MLDYNIAYSMGSIGCICEDMLASRQTLLEGFPFLTAVERGFLPDTDNKSKKLYDFQLVERALKAHGLERFLPSLVDVIVFDAIIGNSDRHQENWGFIFHNDELQRRFTGQKAVDLASAAVMPLMPLPPTNWRSQLMGGFTAEGKGFKQLVSTFRKMLGSVQATLILDDDTFDFASTRQAGESTTSFTPIYDSGCSLGRELTNEKVEQMLRDPTQFESYVRRGKAEVHWRNEKIAHEPLLTNLAASYGAPIRKRLSDAKALYSQEQIRGLLASTEALIPQGQEFDHYRLTPARQEFMFKLIDTRVLSLCKLFLNSPI